MEYKQHIAVIFKYSNRRYYCTSLRQAARASGVGYRRLLRHFNGNYGNSDVEILKLEKL